MKKTLLKRLAALAVCCGAATSFAFAANAIHKTVTIEYANIKLVIDGVEITPTDANGTVVEPFIYNGTTYLPVRAVGDAIGKQVTWDGGSKTVYLGEAPNSKKWMIDLCPPYESFCYETPSSFKMSGKTYTHGFTLNWMGYGLFNLNGNYETLSCDIGHVDGTSMNDAQVEIYLDGDLSQIIEVGAEDLVTHIDIPLHHALQMKIIMNQLTLTGFANCELS